MRLYFKKLLWTDGKVNVVWDTLHGDTIILTRLCGDVHEEIKFNLMRCVKRKLYIYRESHEVRNRYKFFVNKTGEVLISGDVVRIGRGRLRGNVYLVGKGGKDFCVVNFPGRVYPGERVKVLISGYVVMKPLC